MRTRRVWVSLLAAWFAAVLPAAAGWRDVREADMGFDLETARTQALSVIVEEPTGVAAVVAATWWLANFDDLSDPEEILLIDAADRDPELGFLLGLIEHRIRFEAPPGALNGAEFSGAFGVFTALDLERGVVPADEELPPLGTRWSDPAEAFRLPMRTPDAWFAPPASMAVDGIYLVSWTLRATTSTTGWLVVEGTGGYNLELDGIEIDRRRDGGLAEPEITWYRVRLEEGLHRLRIEIGGSEDPRVRVSLLDDRGAPLNNVATTTNEDSSLAGSEAVRAEPPAARGLREELEADDTTVENLLLGAQLERGRGDPDAVHELLERADRTDDPNPWVALGRGELLLATGNGSLAAESARRIARFLRDAQSIPGSLIFERLLAVREGRTEDAERLLDQMITNHGDDVRVLRIWVREAVSRGWARQAEAGLGRLESALPASLSVTGLRLEVLAALERWRERDELLRALAAATPVEVRWLGQMASSCLVDEAIAASRTLGKAIDNPDFDLQLIRLLVESSKFDEAKTELDRTREQWGDLPVLDELELILSGNDASKLETALDNALARNPSDLRLLILSWRQGAEPFYAPFQVDGREFASKHQDLGGDADVVLLLDQAVERIYPDGSSLYYYHGLSRANTPVGARRAGQLQPLAGAHLLAARIIKPDGRVVVPVDIQGGEALINLTEIEPGDLVEEEYVARVEATGATRRGHLPPYIYRFADPDRAFGLSEYVLLVPREIDLQVDGNLEGLERSDGDWRGLRLLQWRNESVPPVALEPFAPPQQDLLPWLNYGFGVSWQDVGDAVRDRVLPVLRSSPELRSWAREAMVGETSADRLEALVNALVDSVQPSNNEITVGFAAGETFAYRRGNRLGVLMAALADVGWSLDLVLTRPVTDRDQRLDVPTLDAFPMALLRARYQGEEFWVDMREEKRGVNHISPFFQGSDGLILPLTDPVQRVSFLDELPTYENPELEERVFVRAELDGEGGAEVAFRMHLRGSQAEQLLERIESVPSEQVAMVYRQIAGSMYPGAGDVDGRIDQTGEDPILELDLTVAGACDANGDELECRSLVLSNPLVPILATLPERTYPLLLRLPIVRRLELELVEPPGWTLGERPPRRIVTGWGSVSESLERNGNTVRSVLEITLPSQTVATEDYPAFARFCQAVDELTTRPPTLERIE